LVKRINLKTSADFRRVYSFGKRFDGELMTVFIFQNKLENHRLGLTASRKAIGNAVLRNRSKRILRETFRLSDLQLLQKRYDWVINAKSKILHVKTQDAMEDFLKIVVRIAKDEQFVSGEAGK
jgi:ribonuclease P protein component